MKRRLSFMLIFSLISFVVSAKGDYKPGYVVMANGDTLVGQIEYSERNPALLENCRFLPDGEIYVKVYNPQDIESYRFVGGKYFVSKMVGGKKIFVEYLVNGILKLYNLKKSDGDHYFLENDVSGLIEIPYQEKIQLIDSKNYLYQSSKHRALYSYFLHDAPQMESQIQKMGEPETNSLIKLVRDYHNIVCKDKVCEIYVKQPEPLVLDFEVVSGVGSYNGSFFQVKEVLEAGLLASMFLPDVSNKLHLRSGVVLFSSAEINHTGTSFKIPVQLVYFFSDAKVRPKVGMGVNLYPKQKDAAFALMGGLSIYLKKGMDLNLEYNVDYCHNTNYSFSGMDTFSRVIRAGFTFNL